MLTEDVIREYQAVWRGKDTLASAIFVLGAQLSQQNHAVSLTSAAPDMAGRTIICLFG